MNLCEVLRRQAQDRPDSIAIIEPDRGMDRKITFAELEDRSSKASGLLAEHGLGVGDRVLILQPISIDLYAALLAVLRMGGVVTLIDPSAGTGHLDAGIGRVTPKAFIGSTKANLLRLTTPSLRRLRPAFSTGFFWPGVVAWKRWAGFPLGPGIAPREPEDDALITFTSGSTGRPKAAVRSHGFLLAQHAALARAIDLREGEVDLATLPVFVLANLASGVTTLLPDADLRRPGAVRTEPIFRQLARHRPTRCEASPAFYERLLSAPEDQGAGRHDDRSEPSRVEHGSLRQEEARLPFRKIFTGGAPVFPRLLRELRKAAPASRVVAVYGSTEAEPIAHIDWEGISADDLGRMDAGAGLLTGFPVPEIELRIVTLPPETPETVPRFGLGEFATISAAPGEAGEIVVSGDHVIQSYLGGVGDEETKFEVNGRRWHRTGDAGYLDERGRLWLLGRVTAAIVDEHGVLHPFAVECAASRFAEIRRSALIARRGERILVIEVSRRTIRTGTNAGRRVDSETGSETGSEPSGESGSRSGSRSGSEAGSRSASEAGSRRCSGSGPGADGEAVGSALGAGETIGTRRAGALEPFDMQRLEEGLAWARLDRIVTVDRIPVDRRHNAKIDYVALAVLLDRHDRNTVD